MRYESVLPPGWYEELLEKADLEASFAALEDSDSYYVDAMRGRIRSLQLRLEEAWRYLEQAAARSVDAPEELPDMARRALLQMYLLENALLSAPMDRSQPAPPCRLPDLPGIRDSTLEEYPEIRYILEMRLSIEGCFRLHLGDYHQASTTFQGLVDAWSGPPDAALALHYCGLAAARHNLGLADLARRGLENAGLALASGGRMLNRLSASGMLAALHEYLGEDSHARDWKSHLGSLDCPAATRESFLRRGQLMLERCVEQKCLLVL
jgi:hypothetical protein